MQASTRNNATIVKTGPTNLINGYDTPGQQNLLNPKRELRDRYKLVVSPPSKMIRLESNGDNYPQPYKPPIDSTLVDQGTEYPKNPAASDWSAIDKLANTSLMNDRQPLEQSVMIKTDEQPVDLTESIIISRKVNPNS